MKSKKGISLDHNTFKLIYLNNKEKALPFAVIVISFFLFLFFILPQISDFLKAREEDVVARREIQTLQEKYLLLNSLSSSDVESKLGLTALVLPPSKDYASIITSLSRTAAVSGITLDDFSFNVGDLSTKSAIVSAPPSLLINLTMKSGLEGTKKFTQNLYNQIPLSEITSIQVGKGNSTLSVLFYYKPFPPLSIDPKSAITPLSSDSISLLNTLYSWSSLPSANLSSTASAF